MTRKEIASLLSNDEVRGRIIGDAAFFDLLLMIVIGLYFTPDDRIMQFYDLIGERLSFNDKIEILKRIDFKKRYKSLECISTLQRVKRLRNLVAHKHFVPQDDKLLLDNELVKMLSDYPESYEREVKLAKQRLHRLANTKEFR